MKMTSSSSKRTPIRIRIKTMIRERYRERLACAWKIDFGLFSRKFNKDDLEIDCSIYLKDFVVFFFLYKIESTLGNTIYV